MITSCGYFIKGHLSDDLDPVEVCFVQYMKQQTQANTPDPNGEFCLVCFLTWKHVFKIGVVKLINEILDNTESDDHPLGWQKRPVSACMLNSLQEKLDTFQSLLTCWEQN